MPMKRTTLPPSQQPLITRLRKARELECFSPSQLPFVDSLIANWERFGSWTPAQAQYVPGLIEGAQEVYRRRQAGLAARTNGAQEPVHGATEMTQYGKLWQLFMGSTKGMKEPILRMKLDNGHILKINKGKTNERFPEPSLWCRTGDGPWIARITPTGEFVGNGREASTVADMLASARAIRAFLANPAKAASAYGHATSSCCFCGKHLDHPSSVEVGYGPDCAARWGLPHTYVEPVKAPKKGKRGARA